MGISVLLAEKLFVMFLMYAVGYIVVRKNLLEVEDTTVLSKIILYICSPCAIIIAFQVPCSTELIAGFFLAFGACILIHILFIAGTYWMNGITKFNSIERASVIYSNAGYLVLPLVQMVLGSEWVFYTCAYTVIQTTLLWIHCKKLVTEENSIEWKVIFLNPNFIAIYVGIIMFVAGIKVPVVINTCLTSFSNMLAPTSMLVIGMLMGKKNPSDLIKNPKIYTVIFFRLVFYPILVVLLLVGITRVVDIPNEGQILLIVLWSASAPVGTTVTQFSQIYHKDAEYASNINAFSVILCMISMPLITMLYDFLR